MPRTVAILHYAGPPTIGGVEATIAAHARVLAADSQHVRIVAGRGGAMPAPIEVVIDPHLSSRGPEIDMVNAELARGVVSPAFETLTASITDRLNQALAGVDAAIVHNVLTLHKNLAFTAALHRLHSAGLAPRILAWCHDFAWMDPLYTPELHEGYPWKLLRTPWKNTRYVAVSEDRRAMLAELLSLPPEQISVATPGVDLAGFLKLDPETVCLATELGFLEADPLLLLPARITRRKNIEQAVAITGALAGLGLQPKLVVTGPPGPHNPANAAYLAQLRDLAQSSGAEPHVVFLYERFTDAQNRPKPVSDGMLADLFKLADGLLFPSRYEGFGMPMIEAGLAGIPIFCSDIAPFREIAGETALYFALDEPPARTASRIATYLQTDQRVRFRRDVRRRYTWEAIYRQVITPLLDERRIQ